MIVLMILKGSLASGMAALGQGCPEISRAGLGLMAIIHDREEVLASRH